MVKIKIQPKLRPIIWGNLEINELFNFQSELPIGEVWLLSGHELYETVMENGKMINEYGESIYDGKYPKFPLLIKLVSTNQWLSVQVHPDDAFAQQIEHEPWGKSEAWYFLEDGEFAICEDVEKMKQLIEQDRLSQMEDTLNFVKVKKGTFVYLPAGTVHALGPNSTVIEVQQTSELTYRIYDWGRPREVHLSKAIQVAKQVKASEIVFEHTDCLKTPYFTMQIVDKSNRDDSLSDLMASKLLVSIPTELSPDFCASVIEKEEKESAQELSKLLSEDSPSIVVSNFI